MKRSTGFLIIGMLMIIGSGFFYSHAAADDSILDGTQFSKQYLIQLSGTIMNETFAGAQALLTIMPPIAGSYNPYQLIIQGFPKKNSRNSLFWNGETSEMTAVANEITCDIKRTYVKQVPIHFFFMSPELLRHTGALELLGDEGKKAAEKVALPTLIFARAGKLKIRIHSDSVSGAIWMNGYDPVEKSFVRYSAQLYGKKSSKLVPRDDIRQTGNIGGSQ